MHGQAVCAHRHRSRIRCRWTPTYIDKHVEHSVDREECLRRDREIQRAMERMATKDELWDVNATLRSIQESIAPHRRLFTKDDYL